MKRLISLLLCIMLVLPSIYVLADELAVTSNAQTAVAFTDVDAKTTQGEAIYKLVKNNILVGYGDGTFKPNGFVTRAELVKMVNLVFGYTESDTIGFPDVKNDDWFYPYTLIAKKAGYITGYEDGTFRGTNNLTRQEACVIITRVADLYDILFMENISDEVALWALPYIRKVLSNRLMTLEEGNKFRATENITRGELALVLSHFVKDVPDTPVTPTTPSAPTTPGGTVNTNGGGGGGGGGGATTKPSNKPTIDSKKQAAVIAKIDDMLLYIKKTRFESTYEAPIINIIKDTLNDVKRDANKNIVIYENDYVKNTYADDIESAKALYEALDDTRKSDFESRLLTNFPLETVDELLFIFFGKHVSDFQ